MKNVFFSFLFLALFLGCSFTKPHKDNISRYVIYPKCETKTDKKACFTKSIHTHIIKNLNKNIFAQQGSNSKVRMYVNFVVDKNGDTKILSIKAPNEAFKMELRRVFESIPKIKPQLINGKAVDTTFTIPVSFVCK